MSEPISLTKANFVAEMLDSDAELAASAGALSIPFVLLCCDGEPVARAVGAMPRKSLEGALGLVYELDRAA